MYSVRWARLVVPVLVLTSLISAGCQKANQPSAAENADIQIALQQPQKDTLVVILTGADGAPVTDAKVSLVGDMNHAGMTPVLADPVADDADGSADGHYQLPFTFSMLGDWIVTVTVAQADGSTFNRDLTVRAGENGIEGDSVQPAQSAQPNSSSGGSSGEGGAATLQVENAVASPAPLAGGTGAVYFVLHNNGDTPITWTGAESPAAAAVEIHTLENDNGVMRMRQVTDGVALGPHESIALTSGSMHLMLVNLVEPLAEGNTVKVTLHFDGADDITVDAPVVSMESIPR
jgi:copper(I)-binding protein